MIALLRPPRRRDGRAVVITNEGALTAGGQHRELYDRVVATLGLDPDDVAEVRIGECGIEVDVVDFEDPDWPLHTLEVGRPDAPNGRLRTTRTG